MSEGKNFFELLSPKSALIVGITSGVLVLCTIGFLVMVGMYASGNLAKGDSSNKVTVETGDNTAPVPSVTKSDKPVVELFIMSYCPYGLQMQKAYLPAYQLLKDKADISVKFVSYAMHEKKEIDENTRQYCMQNESVSKYLQYLTCFLDKGDNASCELAAGFSKSQISNCVATADKKFGITAKYNDQASWLSGRYPIYPLHSDLNTKYGVQGSPTLIINGAEASVNRTPEAVKSAICAAFNNPPAECKTTLSSASFSAGFGMTATAAATAPAADCGN